MARSRKRACYLAEVVGRALARPRDIVARAKWHDEFGHNRVCESGPARLVVVQALSVANLEAAYLEHCRQYALDPELAA